MNKNILQIADYNAPYRGNFISSLEALHSELKQNNCKMFYLFPEKARSQKWVKDLMDKEYFIYFYNKNIFKNYFLICKIVKKHKINIFHVHFRNIKIALPVTLAHLTFKKTFYFTHIHGQYEKGSIFKEYLRRLARWDTFYIGCSQPVSQQIAKAGVKSNRIFCVENAIDFSRLDEYEILSNAEFGLSENTKKILMFGYDWYIKGVDLALEAVESLIKEKNDVVLLISVANNRDVLENYIEEKFGEMPEWLILLNPRNDVATYYNFADVFISPSRKEGFCYSLIEAAYCKTPVLASNIPAQSNLKLLGDVWFKTESVEQLKEHLYKVLEFKDSKLLEAQRKIVIRNYSIDRWCKEILEVYGEVAKFE